MQWSLRRVSLFCIIYSGLPPASSLIKGLFVPICAYVIMAMSLNLTVGILGELSLGHAGFMCRGRFRRGRLSACVTRGRRDRRMGAAFRWRFCWAGTAAAALFRLFDRHSGFAPAGATIWPSLRWPSARSSKTCVNNILTYVGRDASTASMFALRRTTLSTEPGTR